MKRILITIYFLVSAVIYVVLVGALVLFLGWVLSFFAGKQKARRFVLKQVKLFGKNTFRFMFCRVIALGLENYKPGTRYIVTPNHQSLMDIPLILGYIDPMPMVAKKELAWVPGVSWYIRYMRGIFLDRKNPSEGARVIREMMDLLRKGESFLIFPEGTRSEDGSVREFKTAAFKIAKKLGVKVLPVSIWGTMFLVPKKSLVLNPGTVLMKVHEPVDPAQFKDEVELAKAVEDTVRKGVEELKRLQ
ncbi:acyl-phosphate glycerol 3-phosphate acyltransferase [Thermotoga sp. Ku-13t]|uniref:lysophospholipid acyltransferase family protein n=1 Tax=Thermotoga sp. Ku-13t TaxID=1755813 RepID=UPI0013EB1F14|nr:lysophospholipid acyltransferase family protein [Thermotoga sp. Ku-13t]KAF2957963.1 acyl-phosphate glycerol 3-phosphate acyltransferase [Thermotoga sp. Ku-13t]